MTIEAFAPAKINLTLHVTGQRQDGYHLLDSLVAFADVGDRLWLTPSKSMSVEITGPFSEGVPTNRDNLVWRAAELAGWTGSIKVEKNLPNGAGIGGGSSDAAAVLRALGDPGPGSSLGADVPVCTRSCGTRMRGIGDQLEDVPGLPPLPALLVNPGAHVPTPAVFAKLELKENAPMPPFPSATQPEDWLPWLAAQRNDLEAPAKGAAPVVADALDALAQTRDVRLVRMSGSGATCFAIYPDIKAAHFAAYEIGAGFPDWWCVATTLS